MQPPLVSILIPCYNCETWVSRAIETALAQTWESKEIIVLDDGSSDRSLEVIQSFGNAIQVVSEPNRGQNGARNRLTELSQGKWLQYLDADDELAPDKIEQQMTLVGEADVMYGSVDDAVYQDTHRVTGIKRIAEDYEDPLCAAFHWKFPNTSAFLFRRSAIDALGGWDTTLKNCTDYGIYFPLLIQGFRFRAVPDAWSTYRQWNTTQAVYQFPQRLMLTRLQLMWKIVLELTAAELLTSKRQKAFEQEAFQIIRNLYPINREESIQQLKRLTSWRSDFCPPSQSTSMSYRWVYQITGFTGAETLAEMIRLLKRSLKFNMQHEL